MNDLALCLLLSLALHCMAFGLLMLRSARAPRFGTRGPAGAHWHRKFASRDTSRSRGGALLEALLVVLFCGVIAAAIVVCLSDLDLACNLR